MPYLRRIKSRSKPRPGRKKGADSAELRRQCFERDKGICQVCMQPVHPDAWHMAHVRGKRMWGDSLENVKTTHPHCHLVTLHNPKSVPRKPRP